MKLNQLRDLVAIVEHGSLRSAARELDTPQAALSKSIRELERDLGVTQFERAARGMSLTAPGRLFHRRASAIVNEIRCARDELAQTQGDERGTVAAGLSIMPHVGMLPHALPEFRRRYPRVKLKLVEGLFPDMEMRLRDGSIDFYIGAEPRLAPSGGLAVTLLFRNTRTVVARKGHPLAGATSLQDLAAAEWATTSIDYQAEDDLNALFTVHGLPPPSITLETRSALSLMVALAYSDTLALLPAQWSEFPLTRDVLMTIAVAEPLPAPSIVLIRRPDFPLTPAAEFFCDVMFRYVPRAVAAPRSAQASNHPAGNDAPGRATPV